ncbi:MAG: recombination mediator RecR [Aminivibrio sp.]
MYLPEPFDRLTVLLRKLPGVGVKTARRMAFFILQQPPSYGEELAAVLSGLKDRILICEDCGNITDSRLCGICTDMLRDRNVICVVETVEDLIAIEAAGIYTGLYHVLGGRVSPLDGEELDEESLSRLERRIDEEGAGEVIVAVNPRLEGDLTFHAVMERLREKDIAVSRPAYGLPVGGSIEFADRTTLLASLESRVTVKARK